MSFVGATFQAAESDSDLRQTEGADVIDKRGKGRHKEICGRAAAKAPFSVRPTAFVGVVAVGMSLFLPTYEAAEPFSAGKSFAGKASAMTLVGQTWPLSGSSVDVDSVSADGGAFVRAVAQFDDSATESTDITATASLGTSAAADAVFYIPVVSDVLWGISQGIAGVALTIDKVTDYFDDVATIVAGWIPGVHVFAEQIQIFYYDLLEPLVMVPVMAFTELLIHLNPLLMINDIIDGYVAAAVDFIQREYWYLKSFPAPWPRFPVGLPLPPFFIAGDEIAPAAVETSTVVSDELSSSVDPEGARDVAADAAVNPPVVDGIAEEQAAEASDEIGPEDAALVVGDAVDAVEAESEGQTEDQAAVEPAGAVDESEPEVSDADLESEVADDDTPDSDAPAEDASADGVAADTSNTPAAQDATPAGPSQGEADTASGPSDVGDDQE